MDGNEHSWTYDTHADFFFCSACGIEVNRMLFALEQDDNPDKHSYVLLDHIVDVECE